MALEIQDIPMAAISLAVAIIVVAVMSLIIVGVQDQAADQRGTIDNQTLTWAGNNTEIPFLEGRIDTSTLVLYNNGTAVNQGGNYTVKAGGITIINDSPEGAPAGQSEWVTGALNASYVYLFGSAAYNATGDGLTANTTFSSFFPLVALTLVGAIVIGIVVRFFRRPE